MPRLQPYVPKLQPYVLKTAYLCAVCVPRYELGRLRTIGLMAGGPEQGEELFVIYVPQVSD